MDLVVVGADFGSGKRAGWYGSMLMACYNESTCKFETIAKCGSGFTDEKYTEMKK
jgi:DNA ligase-1